MLDASRWYKVDKKLLHLKNKKKKRMEKKVWEKKKIVREEKKRKKRIRTINSYKTTINVWFEIGYDNSTTPECA